jgi:hypothetical protein
MGCLVTVEDQPEKRGFVEDNEERGKDDNEERGKDDNEERGKYDNQKRGEDAKKDSPLLEPLYQLTGFEIAEVNGIYTRVAESQEFSNSAFTIRQTNRYGAKHLEPASCDRYHLDAIGPGYHNPVGYSPFGAGNPLGLVDAGRWFLFRDGTWVVTQGHVTRRGEQLLGE